MNVLKYISDTTYNAVIGLPCGVVDTAFCVGESAVGVAASALSILTVGASQHCNRLANLTIKTSYILPHLYIPVLKVVNPHAYVDCNSAGALTSNIAGPIFSVGQRAACQSDFFLRHVVSRISYALGAAVSVASRIADLALGVIVGAIALFPLFGRIDSVNNFAVEQLMVFGAVHDFCAGLRGFVNPQQFAPQLLRHVDSDGDIYI